MKTLLLIVCLFCLAACQGQTVHTVEYLPYQNKTHDGTVDSGGGNGTQGKPFDYFIVDSAKLFEGRPGLLKLFSSLEHAFLPLMGDIKHIIRDRAWYMIPAELQQIPSYTLGISLSDPNLSKQYALQNRRDIFFNSFEFNKMDQAGQDFLLLHELIMGVRILEFVDNLDQCQANATRDLLDSSPEHLYESKLQKCIQAYGTGNSISPQAPFKLDEDDYSNIRALVHILATTADNMDGKQIETWLEVHRFRVYR